MHKDFYKKVFEDYFLFIKGPKSFLQKQLDEFQPEWIDKKWIGFVFAMHIYYIFSPALLVTTNIVGVFVAFFGVGMFYYISQICMINYMANQGSVEYDQKLLYVFAYCFALAELTGFVINLSILLLNLSNPFFIVTMVLFSSLMLPVAIFMIILKLSIFKIAEPNSFSLITFIEYFIQAFIETAKNKLGFNAWKELYEDFKAAD